MMRASEVARWVKLMASSSFSRSSTTVLGSCTCCLSIAAAKPAMSLSEASVSGSGPACEVAGCPSEDNGAGTSSMPPLSVCTFISKSSNRTGSVFVAFSQAESKTQKFWTMKHSRPLASSFVPSPPVKRCSNFLLTDPLPLPSLNRKVNTRPGCAQRRILHAPGEGTLGLRGEVTGLASVAACNSSLMSGCAHSENSGESNERSLPSSASIMMRLSFSLNPRIRQVKALAYMLSMRSDNLCSSSIALLALASKLSCAARSRFAAFSKSSMFRAVRCSSRLAIRDASAVDSCAAPASARFLFCAISSSSRWISTSRPCCGTASASSPAISSSAASDSRMLETDRLCDIEHKASTSVTRCSRG
mmetsp:Transcript_51046/g.94405  ORF Transcript_51046/g.94405 Transcript_51046/m.94405 type:complete len:361 (-) Transcript_51046:498-1580(-)